MPVIQKDPSPSALPHRCSLIAETVESLRNGISSGYWQEYLPGERILSEHLQVSRNTLRTALKKLEKEKWLEVSQGKRRRINANYASRSGEMNQRIVGVVSPVPITSMGSSILLLLDVLRSNLSRAGFSMEIHSDSACYSSRPARALKKLVSKHPSTVWMLLHSKEHTERWFVRQKIPCLVMGSSRPDVSLPSFDGDHRAACHHAGGMLLRKGHRQIALVLPQDAFGGDADSEKGLQEVLVTSDGCRMHALRHNGSAEHICALMDKALSQNEPPTAFVVTRATHTLTVLVHLLHCGKRIPQDVAIISRDDEPFLNSICPSITRYTINIEQYARRLSSAARQLAESGMLPSNTIRLMPDFLPGETM